MEHLYILIATCSYVHFSYLIWCKHELHGKMVCLVYNYTTLATQ